MILKISAGVVIGLLIYQILMFQRTETVYEQTKTDMKGLQDLKNKYISMTNSLHSYYKKHKKIPEFVADLSCIDVFNEWKEMSCDSMQKDGVFYVNNNNDWASAEPYIFDNKLYIKCRSSIKFPPMPGDRDACADLDTASVPKKETPTFDCNAELDTVQKLICSSDRLTAVDNQLADIYQVLSSASSEDQQSGISDDRNNFIQRRLRECSTSDCVEKMTKTKITRLKLLGVYSK